MYLEQHYAAPQVAGARLRLEVGGAFFEHLVLSKARCKHKTPGT